MGIVKEAIIGQKSEFTLIVIGAICIFISLLTDSFGWLLFIPIAICGIPIIWGAIIGVVFERDITADVLVSVAIVASVIIGEYEAAAEVAVIMQIGGFLEEATVSHANSCIAHLRGMKPTEARVIRDGKEEMVDPESLHVRDIVRILPGETVPADGRVSEGTSSIDVSIITGESTPVDVTAGDRVSAGTVNMYGSVDVEVDRVGKDSTLARMARLIEEADANKSRIARTADRWAVYIVVTAFAVSVVTYLLTQDIYRSVTVLVVFCPCALILATPTAIMAAAGNLSKHGILVKDGGALENLSSVDTVMMDKTGTLTAGKVQCVAVRSMDPTLTDGELAGLVASVESRSEHPLGKAITEFTGSWDAPEDFIYVPGLGVNGTVGGWEVFAGNRSFLRDSCPECFDAVEEEVSRQEEDGFTVVLIGIDGRTVGYAALSDTLRPSSRFAISQMKTQNIKSILITGDSRQAAQRTSGLLGMDDVIWECLPSDKLRIVSKIDCNNNGCMIGDGVNDAPSLKKATVGIAICNANNDLAMESSDIVFMNDDLSRLPGLIRMAKRTLLTIRIGIAFSLILNTVAMALAVLGIIGPIVGALVHNIGSVIVIIASAMLLRYDPWEVTDGSESTPADTPYRCE